MKRILTFVVLFATLISGGYAAQAGSSIVQNLKPHEAWSKIQRGQATLVDVRSRGEWRQTGVPEPAHLVTVHDPRGIQGFINGVKKVVRGNLKKPIALICRSGNRSRQAAEVLVKAGFKNVYNVEYGVLGQGAKKGWAGKGLPMRNCGDCYAEN